MVALAAAHAGAARVLACDIDPAARQACRQNAARNDLELVVCEQPEPCDLILAADLLYEPANRRWLQGRAEALARVQPRAGMALVFKHAILHEGSSVVAGTKYVLRTDVMYRSATAPARPS